MGLCPKPPASVCGDPCAPGFLQTGLRPEPPASVCGDPVAPRHSRRGAPCAPCGVCMVGGADSFRWTGRRAESPASACGDPAPRAASAEPCCARPPSDGASPRTPGVRLRGPHCPAPLPPSRAVRDLLQTGLRPEPPASACGDPIAPRRSRRAALCATSFRRGFAPNPRRPLAGTPLPRAAPAEPRCARLAAAAAAAAVMRGGLLVGDRTASRARGRRRAGGARR